MGFDSVAGQMAEGGTVHVAPGEIGCGVAGVGGFRTLDECGRRHHHNGGFPAPLESLNAEWELAVSRRNAGAARPDRGFGRVLVSAGGLP